MSVVRVEMNYFYMEIICWLNSWRKAFEKCWQWHGSYPLNQCLLWSIYVCFVVYVGLFKNTDTILGWISLCFHSHLTVVFNCILETFYISNCSVLFIIIDPIGPSFLQKVRKVRTGSRKFDKSWSKGHNSRLTKSNTERHRML